MYKDLHTIQGVESPRQPIHNTLHRPPGSSEDFENPEAPIKHHYIGKGSPDVNPDSNPRH
ncbi:uncharacterized conserved protein [Aeropyrum pernix]|uniref:Uncharacterized conserved protein n=1 Tax=Aeropyrum pernix TaxID=56636 RepID=A0A401H918_AERPX|nr:uncharacterized conserved protein [Aeropyrum pernix]